MNGACRGNFQPVSKNFKLWYQFGAIIVMNDGVDNRFTKGDLVPQASADTLTGSYFVDDTVLDSLQSVEYLLAGFNQATEAIILALKQIDPVCTCVFGNLHRVAVLVCQQVACIVIGTILGEKFEIGCKFVAKRESCLLIVDFKLFKGEILTQGTDTSD